VSELQPLIATLTVLYRKGEKITIIITQGDVHPKLLYYLLCGIVQTARTRLRAPGERSDKHLQLLKREMRSCACLGMNHVVTSHARQKSSLG